MRIRMCGKEMRYEEGLDCGGVRGGDEYVDDERWDDATSTGSRIGMGG